MKNKTEFSKKLCTFSLILFIITIFLGVYTSINYDNTDVAITMITTSSALASTSAAFYYNKAKSENLVKIKLDIAQKKAEILGESVTDAVIQEIDEIDAATEEKLDSMYIESINEEVESNI